jgi:hypothetical protein
MATVDTNNSSRFKFVCPPPRQHNTFNESLYWPLMTDAINGIKNNFFLIIIVAVKISHEKLRLFFIGKSGESISRNYVGDEVLASFSHLAFINAGLVLEVDNDEVVLEIKVSVVVIFIYFVPHLLPYERFRLFLAFVTRFCYSLSFRNSISLLDFVIHFRSSLSFLAFVPRFCSSVSLAAFITRLRFVPRFRSFLAFVHSSLSFTC